jgi:hypothetical protein
MVDDRGSATALATASCISAPSAPPTSSGRTWGEPRTSRRQEILAKYPKSSSSRPGSIGLSQGTVILFFTLCSLRMFFLLYFCVCGEELSSSGSMIKVG